MKKYVFRAEHLLILVMIFATIYEGIAWRKYSIDPSLIHNYGIESKRSLYRITVYIATGLAYIVHVALRNRHLDAPVIKYLHILVSCVLLAMIGTSSNGPASDALEVVSLQMNMFLYSLLFLAVQILWILYGSSRISRYNH